MLLQLACALWFCLSSIPDGSYNGLLLVLLAFLTLRVKQDEEQYMKDISRGSVTWYLSVKHFFSVRAQ